MLHGKVMHLVALAAMACAPLAGSACNFVKTAGGGDAAPSAAAPAASAPVIPTSAIPATSVATPAAPRRPVPVRLAEGGAAPVVGVDGAAPWVLPSFPSTLPPMPSGFPSTLPSGFPTTLPSTLPSGWPT